MKKLTQVIAIAAVTAAITVMSAGSNQALAYSLDGAMDMNDFFKIAKRKPDLKILSATGDFCSKEGHGGTLMVKNVGPGKAKGSMVKIVYPKKPGFFGRVRYHRIPPLEKGRFHSLLRLHHVTGVKGNIKIYIDWKNKVKESNEQNNIKFIYCKSVTNPTVVKKANLKVTGTKNICKTKSQTNGRNIGMIYIANSGPGWARYIGVAIIYPGGQLVRRSVARHTGILPYQRETVWYLPPATGVEGPIKVAIFWKNSGSY